MILTIPLIVTIIVLLVIMFFIGVEIERTIAPLLAEVFQRELAVYVGLLVVGGIVIGLLSAKIFMS